MNQLRAVLFERGFNAPQGRHKLEQALTALLDLGDAPSVIVISARTRSLVADMRAE